MCLRCFLFLSLENKVFVLFCFIKKVFIIIIIIFAFKILGRDKVLRTCTFLMTSIALPAVREHFLGFVCSKKKC